MALRANQIASSNSTSASSLQGLPMFWNDPEQPPSMEWDKWMDPFTVALMANHSISWEEIERTPTEAEPRVKALLGDLPEVSASQKVISLLFLSLGETGRKMFRDKNPESAVWDLSVRQMRENCTSVFHVERN